MLDPLSAFALACNVIDVVETGCKILVGAAEYRNALDGEPKEQRELRNVSRTLKNLSTSLHSSLSDPFRDSELTPEGSRLLEANEACLKLSKEFGEFLDRLKVKDSHAPWESLRMSIKARWYKDRLAAMSKALSEARDNLNLAFLLYMNTEQAKALNRAVDDTTESINQAEQSILSAVKSASDSTQKEIRHLAERLAETYLNSDAQTAVDFASAHHDVLNEISADLKGILASQGRLLDASVEDRNLAACRLILVSLYFDQMNARQGAIHEAHASTYRWILHYKTNEWQPWDCFRSWMQATDCQQRLYWIHGKPGSGKSTLLNFLDNSLTVDEHMSSWAVRYPVVKARCFFWHAGNPLQKSLNGLYRTLLYQLLEQCPDTISRVVPPTKWVAAQVPGPHHSEWTTSELRKSLKDLASDLENSARILLLIDGLDEFGGSEEERDDLVEFLLSLEGLAHVKLCVTSRPWNVFQDAFGSYPQLRLEDLTYKDINSFVVSQLSNNRRWGFFDADNSGATQKVIQTIVDKAAGVFLWVRLVVLELLRSLRDGDALPQLQMTVSQIPTDLDKYFMRMIDSVPPQYRRESSAMLQLALYRETEFISTHFLRLLDISFIGEEQESFAVRPGFDINCLNLADIKALLFRLESTIRKLNSRCMGLLECPSADLHSWVHAASRRDDSRPNDAQVNSIFDLTIEFLHRSLHDFLLTPEMQAYLQQHTKGCLDARTFLCSTRLVEFTALTATGVCGDVAIGLASHLLSALSVNRHTHTSALMASAMQNGIRTLISSVNVADFGGYYIADSLRQWHSEGSDFLTLAIDFRLTSYVLQHLSTQYIQNKTGRPILDYILRPRLIREGNYLRIGNRYPDIQFIDAVLSLGADPNQMYEDACVSVWILFILSLVDVGRNKWLNQNQLAYLQALRAMIRAGAQPVLPQPMATASLVAGRGFLNQQSPAQVRRLFNDWPSHETGSDHFYLISDSLAELRRYFTSQETMFDTVLQELKQKEQTYLEAHHGLGSRLSRHPIAITSEASDNQEVRTLVTAKSGPASSTAPPVGYISLPAGSELRKHLPPAQRRL